MLLGNNAEVNLPGGPFGNALVAACNGGRLEIVRLLLSHKSAIERSPMQRFSALHEAILRGQKQIAALLLENGADVNETMKGKAALLVAVESQKEDIVSLLIDNKADINVYHPTDATALHVAIRKSRKGQGETRLAELLLQNGTIVHGTENWTPALHAAVEVGSMDMVQLLLRYNADINEAAKDGATAFSIAGREGLTKIGQVLIGNGANLEEQGSEALTWAAKGGHVGMVRWLLDIGVDVNAGHGLEFAATTVMVEEIQPEGEPRRKTRIEETVELLLDRGSSHGPEALKVAIAFDNKRIVEILRERGFEEDAEEEQLDCDDDYGGEGEN
jgi:ankyrin repeat protein